jgi:hypothetical protein
VSGWDRKEVDRDQVTDVVGEERAPGLRRRGAPLRDHAGDGPFRHIDSQLQEFAMDSGGAPQGIRLSHSPDKSAGRYRASRSRGPFSTPPTLWTGKPRRTARGGAVSAGSPFACTRRAAGGGRGSRERAGGGRRRRMGRSRSRWSSALIMAGDCLRIRAERSTAYPPGRGSGEGQRFHCLRSADVEVREGPAYRDDLLDFRVTDCALGARRGGADRRTGSATGRWSSGLWGRDGADRRTGSATGQWSSGSPNRNTDAPLGTYRAPVQRTL